MVEGSRVGETQGETASPVNITKKNGVILLLERRLEDIQDRQNFLFSDYAHRTIDPEEIKREHCKLHRERQTVEGKLQMAREEAEKRGLNKRDWNTGSRTTVSPRNLDYVQFADKGYSVYLFAVNYQGDRTKGLQEDCIKHEETTKLVEDFVELVQDDDRFHPIPATIHILKAIVEMSKREKNDKAWRIGRVAEDMLSRIEETRPRVIITRCTSRAS